MEKVKSITTGSGETLTLHVKSFGAMTAGELYGVLRVRSAIFVVEQNCVYQDLDDDDQQALHLWITDGAGDIKAVARVCAAATHMKEVSVGRVASVERGMGYGLAVVKASVEAAISGFDAGIIEIEAQEYTRGFYEKVGFRQTSDVFLLDGIPHIKMTLRTVSD